MPLDISDALSDGLTRTVKRNGLLIVIVFVVFGLLDAVAGQTLAAATAAFAEQAASQLPPDAPGNPATPALPSAEQTPLSLPVSLPVALGLVAVLAFVAEAVRIVAVRTLVSDETKTIPDEFVSRNLFSATLNGFVGGIVVIILVGVGLLFFVVPGIFIYISFFFVRQEIAIEDKNFIKALSSSWELTSGNRLRLFIIALVIAALIAVTSGLTFLIGFTNIPLLTIVVSILLGSAITVFGISVTARAYVQLTAERDVEPDQTADEESEWKYNP